MLFLLKLILLSVVAAVALAELYHPLRPVFAPTWLAPAVVHSVLAVFVLFLAHRRGKLREIFRIDSLLPFLPALVILAGVGIMILASRQMGDPTASTATLPWAWILWIPVVEEIVFRAGIGDALRRTSGSLLWGSWFSAVTFALVHADPTLARTLAGEVGLPLGPFLLGLLCEALYVKTGRLLPVILLHAVCNATAALFALGDARWLDWLGFLYS